MTTTNIQLQRPGTAVPAAAVNPNKALWEKGDFTRIAETMRQSGDALVAGVDIARNLVEAGNRRASAERLTNVRFQEGDAADLQGLRDGSFDLVVSIFGAMFAPKPFDVAKEMVRVTRRGGRIVMGNWIPNDPTLVAQILKISAAYSPPPPEGFISPMTWGIEANVLERFGAAGVAKEKIGFARTTYTFEAPVSTHELVATFRDYYGPTMNAFDAAAKNGRAAELQSELEALFAAHNRSSSPNATSIPATYLTVSVTV
jgi:SAM-dependent methyltransferase